MTNTEVKKLREVIDARIENLKALVEMAETSERKEFFKGKLMTYREFKNMLETENGTLEYMWNLFVKGREY